jgi:hypothetical protein
MKVVAIEASAAIPGAGRALPTTARGPLSTPTAVLHKEHPRIIALME